MKVSFETVRDDPPAMAEQTWDQLLNQYDYVMQKLSEKLIQVPSQSRIPKQRELIRGFAKNPRIYGPMSGSVQAAIAALSDIRQLMVAVDLIIPPSDQSIYIEKMAACNKDAVEIPASMEKATPGRDTQFELFAFGCIEPVLKPKLRNNAGPDIEIETDAGIFALELKRPRSQGALENRVRDANSQIEAIRLPGIIGTDATLLFASEAPLAADGIDEGISAIKKRFMDFQANNIEMIRRRANSPNIVAWSLFAHQMVFINGNPTGPFGLWSHTNICDADDPRWQVAGNIFAKPSGYSKF